MFTFKQSESVNARRRLSVYMVNAFDGYTAVSGIVNPLVLISKNGAPYVTGSGSFVEMGSGNYYYEYQTAEVDTLGWNQTIVSKSGSLTYNALAHIYAYDPYDPFGITANIKSVSGVMVKLSDFNTNVTLSNAEDIYFADVKHIKDSAVPRDEYGAQWFRNGLALTSGDITSPYISVYNTVDGSALVNQQKMSYVSVNLGALRYNESTNITASGEPYLVVVSGIVNSATRVWRAIVGIDYLT